MLGELATLSPRQRLERVRGAGPADDVLRMLGEAAEALAVADAGRALEATELLIPIAEELKSPLGRALAFRAIRLSTAPPQA